MGKTIQVSENIVPFVTTSWNDFTDLVDDERVLVESHELDAPLQKIKNEVKDEN